MEEGRGDASLGLVSLGRPCAVSSLTSQDSVAADQECALES